PPPVQVLPSFLPPPRRRLIPLAGKALAAWAAARLPLSSAQWWMARASTVGWGRCVGRGCVWRRARWRGRPR
uniref:Uncharacterized protein n=1 Tax=Aegilops tauschii subsp. strangulata TaxID=200361 RepID=A0A453NSY6_AEGTS